MNDTWFRGWVVVVALAFAVLLAPAARADNVAPDAAKQLVAKGARLVDVRTPEEFAAGHIAGAMNVPLAELDRRLGELAPKERPMVIYCRSGRRSAEAKALLERAGFSAVHDLGAMSRWTAP